MRAALGRQACKPSQRAKQAACLAHARVGAPGGGEVGDQGDRARVGAARRLPSPRELQVWHLVVGGVAAGPPQALGKVGGRGGAVPKERRGGGERRLRARGRGRRGGELQPRGAPPAPRFLLSAPPPHHHHHRGGRESERAPREGEPPRHAPVGGLGEQPRARGARAPHGGWVRGCGGGGRGSHHHHDCQGQPLPAAAPHPHSCFIACPPPWTHTPPACQSPLRGAGCRLAFVGPHPRRVAVPDAATHPASTLQTGGAQIIALMQHSDVVIGFHGQGEREGQCMPGPGGHSRRAGGRRACAMSATPPAHPAAAPPPAGLYNAMFVKPGAVVMQLLPYGYK